MKPDNFELILRESDYTLTPEDIGRIQDKIVDFFVRDYFSERNQATVRRASFCRPAPIQDNKGE